jgi:hypothetical protein
MPIVAFVLGRRRTEITRVRLTQIAAASYVGLFGILLAQALRGQSVLTPDVVTITMLGVWAAATIAAVRATLSSRSVARIERLAF